MDTHNIMVKSEAAITNDYLNDQIAHIYKQLHMLIDRHATGKISRTWYIFQHTTFHVEIEKLKNQLIK